MIGVNNSPLNMFTGGSSNGPSMYQIGYAGGPGGGINAALNSTIDRYHANLDAQNEQTNKLAQIQASSGADLGKEKALIDYKRQNIPADPDTKGPQIIKDPTTGKFFYANHTPDSATGQMKVAWTPVTNSPPTDEKKIFENNLYGPLNNPPASPIPGVQAAPAVAPNIIQQGANGAVADSTGQQTDKRSQAVKILTDAGKLVNEDTINHVMKQL